MSKMWVGKRNTVYTANGRQNERASQGAFMAYGEMVFNNLYRRAMVACG